MHFAQEDILNQNPIAWFPGMAGTQGASQDDTPLGKSAWNRVESQASTAAPEDSAYQRLISDTKREDPALADQTSEERTREFCSRRNMTMRAPCLRPTFIFAWTACQGQLEQLLRL
ncbi:unnamed protein product [Effrenium voratum]|nr:unnamed protein product [Effrenium voratum]